MLIDIASILEYIPHRSPFVMIDTIVEVTDRTITSTFQIKEDNVFYNGQKLAEPALIENIAQTVAAGFGYISKKNNEKQKIGFIGGLSKLSLYKLPSLNDVFTTKIEMKHQFENVHLVKGTCLLGESVLLDCEMKIAVIQ